MLKRRVVAKLNDSEGSSSCFINWFLTGK